MHWWTDTTVPPGLEQAVINARTKLAEGQPMTIDADALWQQAHERMQAEIQEKLERRTAQIRKLPKVVAGSFTGNTNVPPVIDGKRDDLAWGMATALEPLMHTYSASEPPEGTTLAHVTYDATALYIDIRSMYHQPENLELVDSRLDNTI